MAHQPKTAKSDSGGAGEGGTSVETAPGREGKSLGLALIKNRSFPSYHFSFGFAFAEFCRVRHFDFLNSILTRNLEMASSFF
jgi:hypothetical protein